MLKKFLLLVSILLLIHGLDEAGYTVSATEITTETFFIDAMDPGIKLHVRNKSPVGTNSFQEEKIILFIHGASYPGESSFDIDLGEGSWMDYAAIRGFDTYLVDIRGYGHSTRPTSMDVPPDQNPPIASTRDAVRDVSATVDFICNRRGVDKINLVGWSWGTAISGSFTAQNNDKVVNLILYAPLWTLEKPPPFYAEGAYRYVTREAARERMVRAIPESRREEISPQAWFDQWWETSLVTDPAGAKMSPPVLRAPNGAVNDAVEFLVKGIPLFEPSDIRVPVLVIVGEWDADTPPSMAGEVYKRLINAPYKHKVIVPEGTHTMVVEKNRMKLFQEVQDFLEETH